MCVCVCVCGWVCFGCRHSRHANVSHKNSAVVRVCTPVFAYSVFCTFLKVASKKTVTSASWVVQLSFAFVSQLLVTWSCCTRSARSISVAVVVVVHSLLKSWAKWSPALSCPCCPVPFDTWPCHRPYYLYRVIAPLITALPSRVLLIKPQRSICQLILPLILSLQFNLFICTHTHSQLLVIEWACSASPKSPTQMPKSSNRLA